MATARPSTVTSSSSASGPVKRSSTALMLSLMEKTLGQTILPPTSPFLVEQIISNYNLTHTQNILAASKEDRDSVFRTKAELEILIPMLEKSSLKPELKNMLLQRARELINLMDQAADVDLRISNLEQTLAAAETERRRTKHDHYKAIETAADPVAKAAELAKADKMGQPNIEKHKKEAEQHLKLFSHLFRKIGEDYTAFRDAVPGSFNLKTFHALSHVATPTEQQPAARMPGSRSAG